MSDEEDFDYPLSTTVYCRSISKRHKHCYCGYCYTLKLPKEDSNKH